ncbi:MAG: hypothetical protein HYX55_08055 [Chloroflexi bacterium]|nr:hypothetical protein [Chloroflexota bacterium]
MARRGMPVQKRSPTRRNPVRNAGESRPAPVPPATVGNDGPSGLQARLGLAFGAMAFIALPIAYQWTFRPASRPPGSEALVPILELGGILAAAAGLLLGRRARAAGDRSTGAVWAPRLGGAAIVGYVLTVVLVLSRGG